MDYNRFEDCPAVLEADLVEARRRFDGDHNKAIEIRLKPGGVIPVHTTEEEVFFYILEGEGELTIGGETVSASASVCASCPSGVEKGVENKGENLLRILVVKMDLI